jgi:hypothetical protein
MISADTLPGRRRLVAYIVAGDGPHLVAPYSSPTGSVRPRVSLADELAMCLDILEEDPERFERAATSWHARWCSDIADLTLVDAHTALTALESLAGPNGTDAARVSDISARITASAAHRHSSSAGSSTGHAAWARGGR